MTARATIALPYPPPWQDMTTLCAHTCLCESTVENWVRQGLLPPPRLRGGKRMWKWTEVERYLELGKDGVSLSPDAEADEVREATRRAVAST